MKTKKSSDVLGWLGTSGYRLVVDEEIRLAEEKKAKKKASSSIKLNNKKSTKVAAGT